MTYADGAVMRGAFLIPGVDKTARAEREAVAAVGVADLEDFAGDTFTLGYD